MGPMFQINPNGSSYNPGLGGGAIHVRGGSMIHGNSTGPSSDFYAFDMPSALISDACSFSDVRFEMRGANAKLVRIADQGNDFQISATGASGGFTSAQTAGYGGTSDAQPRRKLAYIKNFAQYWPSSVGDEKRLILPPGAVITGVFGKFSASGFSGLTNAYLRVTNDDYSVLFASLSIGAGATGGDFNVQNLLYALGSTATLRTLRLSIGANSASASVYTGIFGSNGGGFLAIEYI